MAESQEANLERGLDFYISYAGKDRMWAEWVGSKLKSAGYTVELDVWDWLPGDNIVLAREAALRRACRVLALCSAAYFGGGFTEQDWTTVIATQDRDTSRLIPVWIEDLEGRQLPDLLRSAQPIKLFGVAEAEASRRLLAGLAGELGLDGTPLFPGPAITGESAQDSSTDPRLPSPQRPATWHVPPRNPDFIGRDSLLVRVRETLQHAFPGMAILQGPGGTGKTQLSIEYAHRFASDYDTVWIIDSEQSELITGQLAELAVATGAATPVADAQTAAAAAIAALRDSSRWLLAFDNVEDPDQLTGLLPDGQGHVLVTTRSGMWQEIGNVVAVDEFSRSESTALLTTRVAALPPADADRVASALGDLPLGLAQAAGVLQSGLPALEFQRLLDSQATKVLSQGKPRSYPAPLAATTLIALDKLAAADPKASNLLCLCSYLAPESIPATWFSKPAISDCPPEATEITLLPGDLLETTRIYGQIRDIGLGRVDQKGLRLHRLTQAIIRDHTANHQAGYLNIIVAVLAAAAPQDSDDPASWPDWSRLVPHLLAVAPDDLPVTFRPLARAAARYLLVSGQTKAALAMTTRLHQKWTTKLGADNTDTLGVAQHLAHAIHATGDYTKAVQIQQDTLARRQRVLGEDHPDTLHSANDLSVSLNSKGQLQEALALNQDTYDRRRRVLGEDHPDTLISAGNLASALSDLGRRGEGLALHQDTYDRHRRVLGEDHPDTLNSANNLASALSELGRRQEALALHQDTYDRRRRVLGEDHPYTLASAGNVATALSNLGRRQEALALHQDTHDRHRRVLGEDHPDTLNSASNLASALSELGRRQEALALHQDTYDRRRRVLGEDHPYTLASASNLASALSDLGRRGEGLALHQDTYDRVRRVLGEDHPDTLNSAGNLASALSNMGRRQEALPLHQDTYDRRLRVLGEDHPDTLNSAGNLASALSDLGRRQEALPLHQDTYDRRRRVLGEDHPDTLNSAGNLASALSDLGRRQEALSLNQDTYDRQRRALGKDHPHTVASANNLAANLERLGLRKAALRVKGQKPKKRAKRQKPTKRKKRQ